MADATFKRLGTILMAKKLVNDYQEAKSVVKSAEFEHFAQNWLPIWVEGEDLQEKIFTEALRLMSE